MPTNRSTSMAAGPLTRRRYVDLMRTSTMTCPS